MKAEIKKAEFQKEYESKFGTLYLHKIWYNDTFGFYSSKVQNQNKFVKGQEAEFTEEAMTGKNGPYTKIKPLQQGRQSNFGRALKREQSRYSGFAMAYAKDLVVAGKITHDEMYAEAQCMFDWMITADKTLES